MAGLSPYASRGRYPHNAARPSPLDRRPLARGLLTLRRRSDFLQFFDSGTGVGLLLGDGRDSPRARPRNVTVHDSSVVILRLNPTR